MRRIVWIAGASVLGLGLLGRVLGSERSRAARPEQRVEALTSVAPVVAPKEQGWNGSEEPPVDDQSPAHEAAPAEGSPAREQATSEGRRPRARDEDGEALERPIIAAIRGRHRTDGERREAMVAAVRGSGPSQEPWTFEAREVLETLRAGVPEADHVTVEAAECYRAGCVARVTFDTMATFRAASDRLRNTPTATWEGGRALTPGVDSGGGRVEASWILLRPNEP